MESYKKGDRVSLKEPLGKLTEDAVGIIVEVYADSPLHEVLPVIGTKDFQEFGTGIPLFDYGVAFPQLRKELPHEASAWVTGKVDLSQFHAGDVIPLAHDELVFVDSTLRDAA